MPKFNLLLFVLLISFGCTKKQPPQERTYPITITEITKKDIPISIETIGNVYSLQTVQVRPQVTGVIVKAFVNQGQYVKQGDPLYLIDPRIYEANLAKAKATLVKDKAVLKFAEIKVERYSKLAKEDYLSKVNYEQYIAEKDAAFGQVLSDEADIAAAELNLEWSTPTSPIDGKISQFNIDVGNLVIANDANALTDIRQIDPADIRFSINQFDFAKVQDALKNGMLKFKVMLPARPDLEREGQIYFVDNHVNLSTGTVLLRGTVSNKDEYFWPGEFVKVRLQLKTEPNALLVPEEALQIGQEGNFVYIYKPESSTVELRKVTKGHHWNGFVSISKGLRYGEKVVVKGQVNLKHGAKVFLSDQDSGQPST